MAATSWWHRALAVQAPPPLWLTLVALAGAIAAVRLRPAWRVCRYLLTLAHEGGHAAVGLLSGRRLTGIRLSSDTSGITITADRGTNRRPGLGLMATSAAGYLTPSLLGLGAAWLLASHHVTLVLWLAIGLMAGILLALGNAFAILSALLLTALLMAAAGWGSSIEQSLLAWSLTWFFLLGPPRTVWELHREGGGGGRRSSDADQLAAITHLPALVWVMVFALATLTCLVVGARWLLLSAR